MKNKYFLIILFIFLINNITAQVISTEDFETETNESTSFTNNGQVFNITTISPTNANFRIQGLFPGTGWNGTANDNKYIDNDGQAAFGVNVSFKITTAGATPFRIVDLWLYLADQNANVNLAGGLNIVGKLGGVTKFTANSTSGFNNTSLGVANGFTKIDFATFGGANNTTTNIDELVFTTTGSFYYVSLDAFKWSTVSAPTNNAPTNITLSATAINENVAANSTVGTLSTTDPDVGNSFTYTLVAGSGSTDNASFNISASSLRITSSPDFETKNSYSVRVRTTDQSGLFFEKAFTITIINVCEVVAATSQTNVSCNGGSNGSATVTPSGGQVPYSYSWAPSGGTAATATGLSAGTYIVTVTDANSCTATRNFTITQPTSISTATVAQTNVSCNGGTNGSASLTPSGGAGGYSYSWAPSGGTAATATGLSAGTYIVTVTDANSCTATRNFTITQPTSISTATAAQTNVSCNGGTNGSASVTPSGGAGGYTYSWAPSGGTAATATGLSAGTYIVTVTDANSCTATRNFTITQPTVIITTGSKTDVSCSGGSNGSATVTPSGGTGPYTYSWFPSGGTAATATGLTLGLYVITVTDANGCIASNFFTINEPTPLGTFAASQTNVSCNGGTNGSASVTPSGGVGGYTYSWSPFGGTAATATGLSAGTYIVTVTDANSCTATRNFAITQPNSLTAITAQTDVSCNGDSNGTATVFASGGTLPYFYSWSPNGGTGATASGLSAGTYTCTITDANACSITQSFILTQPSVITATSTQTNETCNGNANGSATVSPAGGTPVYTYLWSNGMITATVTGLVAGTYTCTITDAIGCSATKSVTITQPSLVTVDAGPATATYCADAITPITATTAATAPVTSNGFQGAYAPANWIFANDTADGNVNTTNTPASITITGGNNFSTSEGNTNYSITFATNTTVSFNWAYTTTDDAGADYPQVIVNGVASTLQDYSIFGSNNQSGTMTVNILAGQTFAFNMFTVDNGGGVGVVIISDLVITNSDVSYSWAATNGGSITGATNTASITPATSGTYTVTATNTNGCNDTDSVVVTITPSSINTTTATACDSYTWNSTTYTTSGLYTGSTANCITEKLNLTINTTPAISGNATQNFNITDTLANIIVSPTNVVWYANLANANAGTSPLLATQVLANNTTYYAVTTGICPSIPFAVLVGTTLAKSTFNNKLNIELHPNPSTGIFYLKLPIDLQIEVYNNLGQLLSSEKMLSGSNVINIADKAAGVYFLKANDGNNVSTFKIIKN
jgi:hypothetical protein